jgi:hypothetical protein
VVEEIEEKTILIKEKKMFYLAIYQKKVPLLLKIYPIKELMLNL